MATVNDLNSVMLNKQETSTLMNALLPDGNTSENVTYFSDYSEIPACFMTEEDLKEMSKTSIDGNH